MRYVRHSGNVTTAEGQEYVRLLNAGMSRADIAAKFNRKEETVIIHLKKHGADWRKRKPTRRSITRDEIDEYCRLLEKGSTIAAIAASFGRSKQTIRRHIDTEKWKQHEIERMANAVLFQERRELRDWIENEMNSIKSYQT